MRDATPRGGFVRRAVIDVGTNSVKVLVADVAGSRVEPVWETSLQTRLGKGYYPDLILQSEPVKATALAVDDFAKEARRQGAGEVRVIGTSAAREARNARDLSRAIQKESGLELTVITGEQEAEWGFAGVTSGAKWSDEPVLVLDVGGGSTEWMLGDGGNLRARASFALGSVRLLEAVRPGDPPTQGDMERARAEIRDVVEGRVQPWLKEYGGWLSGVRTAVGIGGSTAILAMVHHRQPGFQREIIETTQLGAGQLNELTELLWSKTLAERRELPGLPPERADVILMGALIYREILSWCGIQQLAISLRGLRFAALNCPTLFG